MKGFTDGQAVFVQASAWISAFWDKKKATRKQEPNFTLVTASVSPYSHLEEIVKEGGRWWIQGYKRKSKH